ncbi:MAG: butyrate kinase [Lachnospiraceae bacterium]
MVMYRIFTINPGSTSTKIALFENSEKIFSLNVSHDAKELEKFTTLPEQLPYRKHTILNALEENCISLEKTDAFVGRGGGLLAVEGGTYEIDSTLCRHGISAANGIVHPANLGSLLADEFRKEYGGAAFVVNPPDVDEYAAEARITGCKDIVRHSHVHALNQKETAIRHAAFLGKKYEDCNFIVCHIGGGISVAAHKKGKMIDGMDNIEGEGCMAPTRMGAVPAMQLINLCYSGKYTEKEMLAKCTKTGGFVDYFGTSDAKDIFMRAENGDRTAGLVWKAMIYQINKMIGSMAVVLQGEIDGILLGGGMVYNENLVEQITGACSFLAPVTAYPGEFEMEAMAEGAVRVLSGQEKAKQYTGEPVWKGFD